MNSDFKLWVPFPCDDLANVIPIKINDPSKRWDGVPMNHTCSTMPPMHPASSPLQANAPNTMNFRIFDVSTCLKVLGYP